ncbi:M48 family metallopeptidase [Thalassotalea sp. ND16A]|uniref:M48 family metallopeptidase n=1 Tax=Thalassotalea sp. ND16A TaxID=1535422 RepID=UPI00051D53D8|nr:M48 family metallopeptidase [Thalassotalea sp. ND16A]KGJ99700.1 hypothetical protein ND16A_3800 [Thalassotalea sp. ND16A]
MDFFQAQQQARKNTSRLILLFSLAVLSLIVITNVLVMFLFGFLAADDIHSIANNTTSNGLFGQPFDWQMFLFISAVVCLVIFIGSVYKSVQISAGGKRIAESLAGRIVNSDTGNLAERTLLNVVEEMAIASGSPVPTVYLMDHEYGINAFAAGFSQSDAIIAVTQGCLDALNREEIQAVIGHEFSHILNGDMRLNMRLIGILHGILVLGYIGYYILRTFRGSKKHGAAILGLGFGLVVIGFGGNFFGNMIKASVSRKREFLADASAVQFTRSKDGIASALHKISKHSYGSELDSAKAPQMSHAFFSCGVSSFLESMFATHPPIDKRIKRISPYFFSEHTIKQQKQQNQQASDESTAKQNQTSGIVSPQHFAQSAAQMSASVVADSVINSIGKINHAQLAHANALIQQLPEPIYRALHDKNQVRAVIYCLLLSNESEVLNKQLMHLKNNIDANIIDSVFALRQSISQLDKRFRLPVIDLALPALKQLSFEEYLQLQQLISHLIQADNSVGMFEWVLQKVLLTHLASQYTKPVNTLGRGRGIMPLNAQSKQQAITILISHLFQQCVDDSTAQNAIIALIKKELGLTHPR